MSLGNVVIEGGRLNYPSLTNKIPAVEYAKAKTHLWLHMLNNGKKPVKWLKPNSKGSKVDYQVINSSIEYERGLLDLQEYINQINSEFDLDFNLKR